MLLPSIFLSYARADDEPFVKKLYESLRAKDFCVWWDRVSMPSRDLTFLQEIRDAINGVDRLLLVIGPHAVESDYVRAEWEYAREICTPVNPILRTGNFDLLPDELKNLDTRDFRDDDAYADQLDRLIEQLCEDILPLGRLINVPAPPPHYLPRPEPLATISDHVLSDINAPTVITAERKTTAVQGMGGIGKTVIATAFAHACATRHAFSDGVVWVTVGQHAELRALYEVAGVGLGDTLQNYREEVAAKANLQKILADKTCLIVLDDVWQMEHAAPFRDLVADGRSRLLITTRDSGLATGLGAQEHMLDLLRDDQALALLAEWADLPVDALPYEAPNVIRECSNLPLALAMIGATVRGKPDRWRHVLHRLRTADVGKIRQRFPNYPYESVLNAIQVSVDELEPEHRARYLDFAVFREDTRIPEAAVITLWEPLGLDEFDTVEVLDVLVARSLMRREGDEYLRLHDLQVDYVSNTDVRQDAGAEPMFALHERLLSAYRAKCSDGWPTGPNDGYFFDYLGYHLHAIGRYTEFSDLLTSSPDWMTVKAAIFGGDASFVRDVESALKVLKELGSKQEMATLIELRTALQIVNVRQKRYLNIDLETLVWLDRINEALDHVQLRPKTLDTLNGLINIYLALREKEPLHLELQRILGEIVRVAQDLPNKDGVHESNALRHLATILIQNERIDEAFEYIHGNIHLYDYVLLIRDNADLIFTQKGSAYLEDVFDEATQAIAKQDVFRRIDLLVLLAEACAKLNQTNVAYGLLEEAFDTTINISPPGENQARTLFNPKVKGLCSIADGVFRTGIGWRLDEIVSQMESAFREDDDDHDSAISISRTLARIRYSEEAEKYCEQIKSLPEKIYSLALINTFAKK